jgi:aminoglycoside 6'-N-acetyltransferase I
MNGGNAMRIIGFDRNNDKYIQQAADLLLDNFENSWNTLAEAIDEVKESFGEDRISRIAVDEQGNLLGLIGGIKQYSGNVWELHPLVVKRDYQNKGIGRKLVEDFEKRVGEMGGITIILGTDDENNRTSIGGVDIYPNIYDKLKDVRNLGMHPFEFYKKVGYTIVGVIPDANGYGKPDILMAKRIRGK